MGFWNSRRTYSKWRVFCLLLCLIGLSTLFKYSDTRKGAVCGRSLQNQPWFAQRFQKNVAPLLTSSYNLSQDSFDWWKKIYREKRDLAFLKRTTQKLFEIFPKRPPVLEPGPDGCRTCAVVGNSGNLLRSHYGKLIDHHKFVFRINYARLSGFEEHVGRRETHRVMYPESATNLDNKTTMVLFPFKIFDVEWLLENGNITKFNIPGKRKRISNLDLVMLVNPAFMQYVHESWLQRKGRYPSTGFMAVILALHICDEVSVFGFGADSEGNWSHYWHVWKNKNIKTGAHPGSVEYATISELDKQGRLTFYKGWQGV